MYRQTVCAEGKYLAVFTLDMGQTAIQVYDLSLLEYNKDGDEGVSETDKLKDYLGKGKPKFCSTRWGKVDSDWLNC